LKWNLDEREGTRTLILHALNDSADLNLLLYQFYRLPVYQKLADILPPQENSASSAISQRHHAAGSAEVDTHLSSTDNGAARVNTLA